ncbi:MAG TPA: DUF4375 domain-containing protein [Pirellulales bacterium]|nr:DUF4375 domain-containing protein [Pirellulales bacterium]
MAHASNDELRAWDGASLVVALVQQRVSPRYTAHGLAGLNQAERILLNIFDLDNEVFNGGFSQWLFHVAGDLLTVTPACLREIGAEDVAALVQRVLAEFGEQRPFTDYYQREQQFLALPESADHIFREADRAFNGLEKGMLRRLYEFARAHLADFRS